ncbi:MAG: DUF421 domain-containing protein [Oscillospiraceae bacterium]
MALVFIRTILVYILIVFALRLMGKRQLAQLQPSEFVITILISNIATLPIEDTDIPLIGGVIPIITLVAFEVIISTITLKSKKFRELVSGKSKIIIDNGVINQKTMKELRYSLDDLMGELRNKSIFDIKDVSYAIVQTNGSLSVFPKFSAQPATAKMINAKEKPEDSQIPFVVVSDGNIINDSLNSLKLNEEWIYHILKSKNKI